MQNFGPSKNESPESIQSLRYGFYEKEVICFLLLLKTSFETYLFQFTTPGIFLLFISSLRYMTLNVGRIDM